MGSWIATVKATDCATGAAIAGVQVDSPFGSTWTDAYGQASFQVITEVDWFLVRLRREGYVYREHAVQKSDGGTTTICMNPIPAPQQAAKPVDLTVVDGSAEYVTLRWTNPQAYTSVNVGWSRPGGPHHQLDDLPRNTTTATIRTSFTPGHEYDLKVQGRVAGANPPWSNWAVIRWRCPVPGATGLSWFQRNQEKLGDVFLAARPAAVSWGPNRIDVFHEVRGNTKLVGHTWWNGARFESEALDVGAPGDVYGFAAATRGPGWLDVFYNSNRQIWHLVHDGRRWHDAKSIGGPLLQAGTPLAAVSWGGDRLDVFYSGSNGQLCQRYHESGSWSGEIDLGGSVASRPTVASWGPRRLDVFFKGPDSALHQMWWAGHGWNAATLGGAIKRDVAAVSWGPNRLDVFTQGQANDRLFQRFHENGHWSGEIDLGEGPIVNLTGLTVASWAPARLDLFYSNISSPPSALWHHWYSG